jgi:uncharacterized protein HemX
MFTVTSNPFAEMTQGLSGMPRSSSSSLSLQSPAIQSDYNHYHKPKESSNGWWKVILGILALLAGICVCLWLYIQKIAKNEEKKKLEEEKQKRLEEEKIKALE